MTETLRIATRSSELAVWQARHVQARLQSQHPELDVSLVPIRTRGDRITDRPLAEVGGKGLFLKELEAALTAGEAELAVHSMKDVPGEIDAGMALPAVLAPASPYDAFVSNRYAEPAALPAGAVVGTSSPRRAALFARLCPAVTIRSLRGNVQTRLAKLDAGEFDAVLLACAGLERLGLGARIRCALSSAQCLPAIGQGVLGVEIRADDAVTRARVAPLDDPHTRVRVDAERAVNACLVGNCYLPIAAHAEHDGADLKLSACVAEADGRAVVGDSISGPVAAAGALGARLAERLLAAGADRILAAQRGG